MKNHNQQNRSLLQTMMLIASLGLYDPRTMRLHYTETKTAHGSTRGISTNMLLPFKHASLQKTDFSFSAHKSIRLVDRIRRREKTRKSNPVKYDRIDMLKAQKQLNTKKWFKFA